MIQLLKNICKKVLSFLTGTKTTPIGITKIKSKYGNVVKGSTYRHCPVDSRTGVHITDWNNPVLVKAEKDWRKGKIPEEALRAYKMDGRLAASLTKPSSVVRLSEKPLPPLSGTCVKNICVVPEETADDGG